MLRVFIIIIIIIIIIFCILFCQHLNIVFKLDLCVT